MTDNQEKDIITLEFDDGEEVECEILGVFDLDGKEYIALVPDDDSEDVYIYGYVQSGDDFDLIDLDDYEFEMAVKEFERIVEYSKEAEYE